MVSKKTLDFRCISINTTVDSLLVKAGEACGLSSSFLQIAFPNNLTMWIDPLKGSYRIGTNGCSNVLYEYNENYNRPWKPALPCKSINVDPVIQSMSNAKSELDIITQCHSECNHDKLLYIPP